MLIKTNNIKTAVVSSDHHEPFLDTALWEDHLEMVRNIKPNLYVRNGDIFDFYQISHFLRDVSRESNMTDERNQFYRHDLQLNDALYTGRNKKDISKIALPGNHEFRINMFLWNLRQNEQKFTYLEHLMGVKIQPTWYNFLKLKNLGYNVKDFKGRSFPYYMIGRLLVTHGTIVRTHSAYTARGNMEKYGVSMLTGHTHRGGTHFKTNHVTTHRSDEGFCMCDPDAAVEYIKDVANWQQGFNIVRWNDKTGWFNIEPIIVARDPETGTKQFMVGNDFYSFSSSFSGSSKFGPSDKEWGKIAESELTLI